MLWLLVGLIILCASGSATLLSCDLAWVPMVSTATNSTMTVGSYRFNLTFNGAVTTEALAVPIDFSGTSSTKMIKLFTVSDSTTNFTLATAFRFTWVSTRNTIPAAYIGASYKQTTVFSGSSLFIESPLPFVDNVTYRIAYLRPPITATAYLFVGGAAESSFSCDLTIGRLPRMYHMTELATTGCTPTYTQLISPVFTFTEPVQDCYTGARFSSANVRTYDTFQPFLCPYWNSSSDGRTWWCSVAEPGLEATKKLWNQLSLDSNRASFKNVILLRVCAVNGNIPVTVDDFLNRHRYALTQDSTACVGLDTTYRLYTPVMNLTSNTIHAVLPVRSYRGLVNDSVSARYYDPPFGFPNDPAVQTFPNLDFPSLINGNRVNSAFYPNILDYKYTVAGMGMVYPSSAETNVSVDLLPASIRRTDCWMEYRSELGYSAMVCRFYTTTWIGRGIGLRIISTQSPAANLLGTSLELDTTADIYANAYRTVRSSSAYLPSGMQTYLSHADNLYAFVRLVNVTLLDSTPLTLQSVRYSTYYNSLQFTFGGCNLQLLNFSTSRIVSPCTLGSTFTLLSACAIEVPILDSAFCRTSTVDTLFDAVWTTQQAFPTTYSAMSVGISTAFADWPMQVTGVYMVNGTRLFLRLSNLTSSPLSIQLSNLTLSCGTVSSATFYSVESTVELTFSGCVNVSTATLTVGGAAFTTTTQNVYPSSTAIQFLTPYVEPPFACVNTTVYFNETVYDVCTNTTLYFNETVYDVCINTTLYFNETVYDACVNTTLYFNETVYDVCTNTTLYFNETVYDLCVNTTLYFNETRYDVCVDDIALCETDCSLSEVPIEYVMGISVGPAVGVLLIYALIRFFVERSTTIAGATYHVVPPTPTGTSKRRRQKKNT